MRKCPRTGIHITDLFDTEPTNDGHMTPTLLELVEDTEQRFIVGYKWNLVEGNLAKWGGLCT